MIPRAVVQADRAFGHSLRRVLTPTTVTLAMVLGAVGGLLVRGVPSGALAVEVFPPLVAALAAVLVVPLVAGVQTGERHGGFEQLVAVRPIGSLVWTLGRVCGSLGAAGVLVVLLAGAARLVGGTVAVPETVEGTSVRTPPGVATWRFALPAGSTGPFELQLQGEGPRLVRHELLVEVARGSARSVLEPLRVAGRTIRFDVPDLAPARGDLFVTWHGPAELLLAPAAPQLVIGRSELGRRGLPLPFGALTRLLLAACAAIAAACVFRFETACLAGLLALLVDWEAGRVPVPVALLGLLLVALCGTALARRTELP